jgi:hypothetical protein
MSNYTINHAGSKRTSILVHTGSKRRIRNDSDSIRRRSISDDIPDPPNKACCSHFVQASWFLKENFCDKMKGDLLLGTNSNIPTVAPLNIVDQLVKKSLLTDISPEEKKEAVVSDPRFGMFSLFKYHLNHGYINKKLRKGNVYCFSIFSLFFALPILIFLAQWLMYVSLIINQQQTYTGSMCPNISRMEQKVMMSGISIIYFVRSFFIWDSFTNRTRLQKMNPGNSISVIFDTYQEFGFNLIVYLANLWLVFVDDDLSNMIMNSLAMEFLMNLDNEFEELYFKFLPQSAIDIYDNIFVTPEENAEIVEAHKKKYCCYKCISCVVYIPFKILVLLLFLFPVFCFFMIFYGAVCK